MLTICWWVSGSAFFALQTLILFILVANEDDIEDDIVIGSAFSALQIWAHILLANEDDIVFLSSFLQTRTIGVF